jgi:excisionase family DNA binding protein
MKNKYSLSDLEEYHTEKSVALEIPFWQKYTLSVQEAAEYFGISDKKIRQIVCEHPNENYILWNGTRPRIKRMLFEKYVDEKLNAI